MIGELKVAEDIVPVVLIELLVWEPGDNTEETAMFPFSVGPLLVLGGHGDGVEGELPVGAVIAVGLLPTLFGVGGVVNGGIIKFPGLDCGMEVGGLEAAVTGRGVEGARGVWLGLQN